MGEGVTIRKAEGKPRVGMTSLEGDNSNGSIYAAQGNTEGLGTYLKCLYTNARSMRNKQDELETLVSSQSYRVIGISKN